MLHEAAMTAPDEAGNPPGAPPLLAIAGATCSGKSALASSVARHRHGVVINADSMQVYSDLRILTARPTVAEEQAVPHRLYGIRAACEPASAAWWAEAATAAIDEAHGQGRLPILCGGTGLYFAALAQGLAPIPEVSPAARNEARGFLASHGPEALHARLAEADPATAATLRPTDGQRLARAWEVWRGTGKGLAGWNAEQPPAPRRWSWRAILLDPPRDDIRQAIARRTDAMLAAGAVEEVAALLAQRLDPALPAMRAHGVPELAAFIRGETSLATARARICLVTGQYTKRQATWFRHHTLAPLQCVHQARVEDGEAAYRTLRPELSALHI